MNRKSLLPALLLLTSIAIAEYIPNRNIGLPDGVFEVDYSPDQQYLGAATLNQMIIYKGRTGAEVQRI